MSHATRPPSWQGIASAFFFLFGFTIGVGTFAEVSPGAQIGWGILLGFLYLGFGWAMFGMRRW